MNTLTDIDKLVIQTRLKRVLSKPVFDFSPIRECMKTYGMQRQGKAQSTLSLLHNEPYSSMPERLRLELPMLIAECLSVTPSELKAWVLGSPTEEDKHGVSLNGSSVFLNFFRVRGDL